MITIQKNATIDLGGITQLLGGATQATSGLEYLTPEALLTYVETQLRSLDGDIRKRLDGQREVIARKKLLGDIENAVAKGKGGRAEIESAIAALPENDPLRAKLQEILEGPLTVKVEMQNYSQSLSQACHETEALFERPFSTGPLTDEQSKALETTVKNELADVNAAAEINMIEVQSLMSQRTTAVQLGTGIMQKINQSLEMISKNI